MGVLEGSSEHLVPPNRGAEQGPYRVPARNSEMVFFGGSLVYA